MRRTKGRVSSLSLLRDFWLGLAQLFHWPRVASLPLNCQRRTQTRAEAVVGLVASVFWILTLG